MKNSALHIEMIRIPAGTFLYGDDEERLELPEFWIGKTPVTNGDYARFTASTNREPPKHWNGPTPPEPITDHPVVHVSWEDAVSFAEWAGKRLPTQEEWEKAARGTDGRRYPWGVWQEGRCNTEEVGIGTTSPVGQFSPMGDSPYGCVDMAGNVFEWTASPSDKYYVLRGGSFNHIGELAQCTSCVRHKPSFSFKNLGFRVAETRLG